MFIISSLKTFTVCNFSLLHPVLIVIFSRQGSFSGHFNTDVTITYTVTVMTDSVELNWTEIYIITLIGNLFSYVLEDLDVSLWIRCESENCLE